MSAPLPTTLHERVAHNITNALALLHAAERQFRLHHTDAAISLLIQAEARYTNAHNILQGINSLDRYEAQQRLKGAQDKLETFRLHMSES